MSNIPTVEKMLKAGVHFGHKTSKWHPKMGPYIFTSRNGVHIIDLVKSRKMLGSAIEFIEKLVSENKTILFVGTKMQVGKPLRNMAREVKMPYVDQKWLGGCLTNFAVIRKLTKKYQDLLSDKMAGRLDKYTKKERLEFDREIEKLEKKVGGLVDMKKIPDAIFIWDIKYENTALTEAKMKNVPIIGVCDTNTNPTGVNYIIPSNDDATKAIKLILNTIRESILEAQKKINK